MSTVATISPAFITMDTILRLHDQDNTGVLLRQYFDAQDPPFEDSDYVPFIPLTFFLQDQDA